MIKFGLLVCWLVPLRCSKARSGGNLQHSARSPGNSARPTAAFAFGARVCCPNCLGGFRRPFGFALSVATANYACQLTYFVSSPACMAIVDDDSCVTRTLVSLMVVEVIRNVCCL